VASANQYYATNAAWHWWPQWRSQREGCHKRPPTRIPDVIF